MTKPSPREASSNIRPSAERRKSPRYTIRSEVLGRLDNQLNPLRIADLSAGGFSIVSEVALAPGTHLPFQLIMANGTSRVNGRSVHTASARHHTTGFEFVLRDTEADLAIDQLVNQLSKRRAR